MIEFKIGDYIEVGMGDSVYDENGWSYYFKMDIEGYNELEISEIFEEKGNVLYVNKIEDEDAINFAGDKKFSHFLRNKKYVKIELEVELPLDYNEGEVDTAIADAIYRLGGQVLDSKEFKEIIPNNL